MNNVIVSIVIIMVFIIIFYQQEIYSYLAIRRLPWQEVM